MDRLRALLEDPFSEHPEHEASAQPPPTWGRHLVVSCSSWAEQRPTQEDPPSASLSPCGTSSLPQRFGAHPEQVR
ncbi:hypothetical protein DAT35_08175 [Vitiosangium sp. GDMCC 1.1324]|nr:hypothetical protein DAT35_08175 [Vitiosangium sp. GDMCC 1.1324]